MHPTSPSDGRLLAESARPAVPLGTPGSRSPHFFSPPVEGGCEGLAMLNRTNRTLSANLNRLNLGTRSLAATANVNKGDLQTLRIRHDHRVVMRDGMHVFSTPPI